MRWWQRGKSGWVRVKQPLLLLLPLNIVKCAEKFASTGDTAERPPGLVCGPLIDWAHWRVNITTTTIDSPVILDTIRTIWLSCVCLDHGFFVVSGLSGACGLFLFVSVGVMAVV